MKTIYKYPLSVSDKQTIKMPVGAQILTVQVQESAPCIWALVESEKEDEDRYIEIFGTGRQIHVDMGIDRYYIGTFQQGPFVWHVFERI
jgi:hypothetical protein